MRVDPRAAVLQPRRERGRGGLDRGIDLLARSLGHFRKHLAGRGIQYLLDLAAAGDELAIDQELRLHGRLR